jgi:hypothetical protein
MGGFAVFRRSWRAVGARTEGVRSDRLKTITTITMENISHGVALERPGPFCDRRQDTAGGGGWVGWETGLDGLENAVVLGWVMGPPHAPRSRGDPATAPEWASWRMAHARMAHGHRP